MAKSCLKCRHYQGAQTCPAFPEQIPFPIVSGAIEHTKVWDEQQGKLIWEERDGKPGN